MSTTQATTPGPAPGFVAGAMKDALPQIEREMRRVVSEAVRRVGEGPDPVDVHVGREIRIRRKALGMSQGELAKGLAVSFQQVQKYEKGGNRVSASMLHAVATILGCSEQAFFPPRESADDATVETINQAAHDLLVVDGGLDLLRSLPLLSRRELAAVKALVSAMVAERGGQDEG